MTKTSKKTIPGKTPGRPAGGPDGHNLRAQAEKKVRADEARTQAISSPRESARIVHELQVHQIELEMQNEEMRRAQAELEASRARYFDLYDMAPVGYFTLDEKGMILEANLTAAGLLGAQRSDLVNRLLTQFILPEDQDIYYRHRKLQFETGAPQICELRMRRADAGIIWTRIEAAAGRTEAGDILCRAVLIDITERKRAEEEIRGMALIVDTAPNSISVHDFDGRFFYANQKTFEWHGYSRDEFLALNLRQLDVPAAAKLIDARMKELLERGEALFETAHFRKDGTTLPLEVSVKVTTWEGKKALLSIATDISERKRAEEAIQASLREKEVMLREIHHRVKNNMQVISSLFNLQAGHTQNLECRKILKEGQARIRAMSLVHEKLYQSHDLSKIDLAAYIQSLTVHLFQIYAVDPLQVRLETDFGEVSLDINSAVPCGLILNELISNALKHAFSEGRRGLIRIGLKRAPDDKIVLRVADDGVGFPKNLDFRQAPSFGLQIVNLLIGQLDGAFSLDQEQGTAFTITFRELKYAPRI